MRQYIILLVIQIQLRENHLESTVYHHRSTGCKIY